MGAGGFNSDVAAVIEDDLLNDSQAKPCTVRFAKRNEGLKEFVDGSRWECPRRYPKRKSQHGCLIRRATTRTRPESEVTASQAFLRRL